MKRRGAVRARPWTCRGAALLFSLAPAIQGRAAMQDALPKASSPQDVAKPHAVFLKPAGDKEDPWAPIAEALRKHYRIVTLPMALPKGAESSAKKVGKDPAPHPASERRSAANLIETIRERKLSGCTLLALGDDARVAIEAAAARPDLISALVLIDCTPPDAEGAAPQGDGAVEAEGSAWNQALANVSTPTLALYRADLILGVGSAGQYLKATGLDALEHIRVRRMEAEHPILKTASAAVSAKVTGFLDEVRRGRDITPETRKKTSSGLSYIDQIEGEGESPREGQTLAARFRFRTRDGRDVSPPGAMNITWRFGLDHALTDGVYEALSTMQPGGRRKVFIPAKLLRRPTPGAGRTVPDAVLDGQNDTMTVDIFLSDVSDDPPPPPKPRWEASLEKPVGDGVRIIELVEGTGPLAEDDGLVEFADNLWSASGHLSRYKSAENPDRGVLKDLGDPSVSPVAAKCWPAGIRGMKPGGERLIIAPARGTFGDKLLPSMRPDEDLVFHVRLLDAKRTPPPPAFPVVPKEQLVTVNPKLRMFAIKTGNGASPPPDGAVALHYTMWRNDGKLVADSTVMRDRPFEQFFRQLTPAFREVLPKMKVDGVCLLHVQDPFGPGKQGLEPGEWVHYLVELRGVMSAEEFEAKSHPAPGRPIPLAPEVQQRILRPPSPQG